MKRSPAASREVRAAALLLGGRALLVALASACGCASPASPPRAAPAPATAPPAASAPAAFFEDVTDASRIDFVHDRGAEGRRYLPETMGSGGCVIDADGDGLLDLYFVQSGPVPGSGSSRPSLPNRLFRNRGDGTFEDVTAASGAGDTSYGMGATCADYDGDGDTDIYVVNFGRNTLLRNDGTGRFADVTAAAGVGGGTEEFGSSAAFLDGDGDGDLDLYVVNYVNFTVKTHVTCHERGIEAYCHPDVYEATPDVYYENRGDGTFRDATRKAGLAETTGKGLGVVVLDFDDDGDSDIYVTDDQTPNMLWRNRGDGTFEDAALLQGVAFGEDGKALAGMGVDAGDLDADGRLDLVVTNFAAEPNSLYLSGERGFRHGSRRWGIQAPSLPMLGFGCDFFDADDDGDLDLLVANGHLIDNIRDADPAQSYPQPAQLFLNDGAPPLRLAGAALLGSPSVPRPARGTMTWDQDSDGRLDLVVTTTGDRARLHRNVFAAAGHWIGFLLEGRKANRDGIGARVIVEAGGRAQLDERRAGSSYQTSGDPRVHFGLGAETFARVTVKWSATSVDVHERLAAGRYYRLVEGGAAEELSP